MIAHGRALAKATLFGATNPQAALAIMKKVNPEEQVDEAFAKTYFDLALQVVKPRPAQNQYGWHDRDAWRRSMQNLMTPGVPERLEQEVDLNALLNNDLVTEYNNFDKDAVIKQAREYKG